MLSELNPMTFCDFYKVDHRRQYPDGTEFVYSNFTPRYLKIQKLIRELKNPQKVYC